MSRRAIILLLALAPALRAQQPDKPALTASAVFTSDAFVGATEPIAIALSRLPAADEGRVAVLVGAHDLTALFELRGAQLVFRGSGFRLPSGTNEMKIFLVAGNTWTELGRFPLRVRVRSGLDAASVDPALTINNKGQVAEKHTGSATASARPTYQDGTAGLGLQTAHGRGKWSVQTQVNTIAVTNEKESLRFGIKGDDAPRFDLSDYVIRVSGPGAQLAAGHVGFGNNRHLISGFSSRGITATLGRGMASLSAGALHGSSIVGWDNLLGMNNGDHRIAAATLALELAPKRPGALHIDASVMDGSLLPNTSYTEGGIVDAETSSGLGIQFTASSPGQRLRASGGLTRSRFADAFDAQLFGDTTIVRARPRRRAARYAEASAGLLQNQKLIVPVSLNVTARHERVEPLYRSVAAYTQADIERNGVDLSGNIGVVNVQVAATRSRDNLDRIASILTTRTDLTGGSLSVPLAALLRVQRSASLFPTLSFTRQQTHQRGEGLPLNSDFQASHVPDQMSTVADASAQWQGARLRLGYRFNESHQDNRQVGRERSDLRARTHSISVGVIARANLDLQVEGGFERQENIEFAQVSRVRRVGVTGNWRADALTTADAFVSLGKSKDEGSASESLTSDLRFGISRGIRLWHTAEAGAPGQVFIRVARTSSRFAQFGDPLLAAPPQTGALVNVSTGLSLKLF